jgi:SPP1 family predicted phage head-tail adaptor
MKAGELRNRVTIQMPSTVQDETGQMLTGWTDLAPVWASIQHVSGLSAIRSGMDTSSVKASIRIRHRAGINAGMRILHGDTVYNIEAVMPAQGRAHLDIIASVKNAVS